jgi:hypothetical protein
MHHTVELDSLFIALAVLMFIMFAIAVLIIIDHKARIHGGIRRDPFSISGIRRNHPIWAWMVSVVLWLIIGVLLASSVYSMVGTRKKQPEGPKILAKLDVERQSERIKHFHNSPAVDPTSLGKKPVCYYCHGEYPHSKKPMVRTLLNMHTQFAGCMTCHADNSKIPESTITLRWLNYSGMEVKGKPFGTDVNAATGDLIETDDFYSKIVPYQVAGGKEHLLEITEDSPEAQEFLKLRGQLSAQDQGSVKKAFHNMVNPIGRFCTRCHAPEKESYIPFRALGFSEKRVTALTNLNIVGIVQKYKEFYIPTISGQGVSEEQQKVLLGQPAKLPEATDEMKRDPRAWWRKTYDTAKPEGETPNAEN